MAEEPTAKKQKIGLKCSLTNLPTDTLFLICTFCEPAELFYAIPFICKPILRQLKISLLSEEQISAVINSKEQVAEHLKQFFDKENAENKEEEEEDEEEEEEIKKSEAVEVKNPKPSYEDRLRQMFAVEENRIWKQYLMKKLPCFSTTQADHLFCFKRLYFQFFSIDKPPHAIGVDLSNIAQTIASLPTKHVVELAFADSEKLKCKQGKQRTAAAAIAYHSRQLNAEVLRLSADLNAISKALTASVSHLDGKWRSRSRPQPEFRHELNPKFKPILMFLTATAISKSTKSSSPTDTPYRGDYSRDHTQEIILLSPVNANMVKFKIELSARGKTSSYRFVVEDVSVDVDASILDYQGIDNVNTRELGSVALGRRGDVIVTPLKLWPFMVHLGLDSLCTNAVERVELAQEVWETAVHGLIEAEQDVYETALECISYEGPKRNSTSEDSQEQEECEVDIRYYQQACSRALDPIPPKTRPLQIKGRTAVHPECEIAELCHVLEEGDDIWVIDLEKKKNHGVKKLFIQLLQDDEYPTVYHLFIRKEKGKASKSTSRSVVRFKDLQTAKEFIETTFHRKTGNIWKTRLQFQPQEGKYQPVGEGALTGNE